MAQDLGQQAKEKIVKQKIVGLSGNQTGNQTGGGLRTTRRTS